MNDVIEIDCGRGRGFGVGGSDLLLAKVVEGDIDPGHAGRV